MLNVLRVAEMPSPLEPQTAYLHVEEGLPPWSVSFLCPCGCGEDVCIPLDLKGEGPMWRLESESPLHINPSLQRTYGCKSHFFVHQGEFRMC